MIFNWTDEMDDDGESASSQNRPDDADSSPFWQLMDVVLTPADGQGETIDYFISRWRMKDFIFQETGLCINNLC